MTQDDDAVTRAPRRYHGSKWSGRGRRRLRNEERRDDREQRRGGKGDAHLGPRDWQELLDDGTGDGDAVEREERTTTDARGIRSSVNGRTKASGERQSPSHRSHCAKINGHPCPDG